MDSSYTEVMRLTPHNGIPSDLHEFIITPDNIAYFTAYRHYKTDLKSVKGPSKGPAIDATIQGVDLITGDLVFNWSSSSHIPFSESYTTYSKSGPYDPIHVNSIYVADDGNLIVSARNTWAVYKVDRQTGDILWRLGGKNSDFDMGPGTRFAWQHDARLHPGGNLTLFDDEGDPPEAKQSRGLVLAVDEAKRTATLKTQYRHPERGLLAGSQGNVQLLADGHVFIGWGAEPYFTEFTDSGARVLDGKMASGTSYRAFRLEWSGSPTDKPAVGANTDKGVTTAYASWNGSTATVNWQLFGGPDGDSLIPVAQTVRTGFETSMRVPDSDRYVAVAALDAAGHVLGTSDTIKV